MKRLLKKGILGILFALITAVSFGQIQEPVKWEFCAEKISEEEYKVHFISKIEEGWHVYAQDVGVDVGPIPTSFHFDSLVNVELKGKVYEPKPIVGFDKNYDADLAFYEECVSFTQTVLIKGDKPYIKGALEYMTCNDEMCLPPTYVDFEFNFKDNICKDGQVCKFDASKVKHASGDHKKEKKKKKEVTEVKGQGDCNPKVYQDEDAINTNEEFSYWGFLIIAFLSGLAAILTPCVFPMIPMTVTFFLKDAKEDKASGIRNGIIYGISIIAIYCLIGTVFAVVFGAEAANFLSTHWIPNVFFFLIFVVFAASFFGMFEITMPSWLINKMDAKADKGGLIGVFFMAFTLVLVSFSCTGPIVGSILVEASNGEFVKPLVGMFGFSLAFALPFSIFAMFPALMDKLPQSGGWLNSVKVVLGFVELGFGLKFLSVADQTYHWGILDREVYLAIWIILAILLGIYLLGKLKFSHDSELPYVSVPRLIMAIISFSFAVYLMPGMLGHPLNAMAGYLPPMETHDYDIKGIIHEATGSNDEICEEPRFGDILHLPHGLKGYFDYDQAVKCGKELGKPIFIDFTGHGCVNCRKLESTVWNDPASLKMLREEYIVVALYVDDKTELPEDEWVTSKADGKVKKTIGAINADREICEFNVNAQPYYCLLDDDGELLQSPQGYRELNDDKAFRDFLKAGLDKYKKRGFGKKSKKKH